MRMMRMMRMMMMLFMVIIIVEEETQIIMHQNATVHNPSACQFQVYISINYNILQRDLRLLRG